MAVVTGFFKGLGAIGLVLGPIALIAGLVVGLGGLADGQDCADRENSFNPCGDAEGEIIQAKLIGGSISGGAGIVLLITGSLTFFIARGAERRAEAKRVQPSAMPALPSVEDQPR